MMFKVLSSIKKEKIYEPLFLNYYLSIRLFILQLPLPPNNWFRGKEKTNRTQV